MWDRLRDLRRDFNMTILISTHDMDEADVLCDVLALLHEGKVAVTGKPADLKAALGATATLDDVFIGLVTATSETETKGNYGEVRRDRRAASEHG